MAWAPSSPQRMPAPLSLWPTTVLQALSTTPLPMCQPSAWYSGYSMRCTLFPKYVSTSFSCSRSAADFRTGQSHCLSTSSATAPPFGLQQAAPLLRLAGGRLLVLRVQGLGQGLQVARRVVEVQDQHQVGPVEVPPAE